MKIALTENSAHYHEYFPGYHLQSLKWQTADPVELCDTSLYFMNVHLPDVTPPSGGPGYLSGMVISGLDMEVGDVTVILSDQNHDPLVFAGSGDDQPFEFSDLALGTYHLYAEAAGYYTSEVTVHLNESQPSVTGLTLEVMDQNVPGIFDRGASSAVIGDPFPNPAGESIGITVATRYPGTVFLSIFDLTGKEVLSAQYHTIQGKNVIRLGVGSFRPGVYCISLSTHGNESFRTSKWIKK